MRTFKRSFQSFLPALGLALGCLSLAGCSTSDTGKGQMAAVQLLRPSYAEVEKLASEHEHQIDDGWFFGQYPRIFKSAYAGATPKLKAQFAVDYAQMLADANQDLVANWDSYVTYTNRADFAKEWWQKHDDSGRFAHLNCKMHVVWIHEALLDGGELWWRTFEAKNGINIPTAQALAHDEEQKKVFAYMDREGQPRSLSDLVAATPGAQEDSPR
jgi:hypothetical protein